jgi:hypothetical protein
VLVAVAHYCHAQPQTLAAHVSRLERRLLAVESAVALMDQATRGQEERG